MGTIIPQAPMADKDETTTLVEAAGTDLSKNNKLYSKWENGDP